jgi:hypothetical protein
VNPETLAQWLRRLRREFGVQCRLRGDRVSASRFTRLPQVERDALLSSVAQVQAHLERRAERRRRKEQKQSMATVQQRPRKVIGQHVVPGYPHLTRPLFEDEVKRIPARPGRVLGTPYGWRN